MPQVVMVAAVLRMVAAVQVVAVVRVQVRQTQVQMVVTLLNTHKHQITTYL
jgi:hypothetical protein